MAKAAPSDFQKFIHNLQQGLKAYRDGYLTSGVSKGSHEDKAKSTRNRKVREGESSTSSSSSSKYQENSRSSTTRNMNTSRHSDPWDPRDRCRKCRNLLIRSEQRSLTRDVSDSGERRSYSHESSRDDASKSSDYSPRRVVSKYTMNSRKRLRSPENQPEKSENQKSERLLMVSQNQGTTEESPWLAIMAARGHPVFSTEGLLATEFRWHKSMRARYEVLLDD